MKQKLRMTIQIDYEVDKENYPSDNPNEMAKFDYQSLLDDPSNIDMFLQDLSIATQVIILPVTNL